MNILIKKNKNYYYFFPVKYKVNALDTRTEKYYVYTREDNVIMDTNC